MAEEKILAIDPNALIVRTSNLFSPWDNNSFIAKTLTDLRDRRIVRVARGVTVSPTYTPDLINESLNLLLDNECGIHHVATESVITWTELGYKLADMAGLEKALIKEVSAEELPSRAKRPKNNCLTSEKGIVMPPLENALQRYLEAIDNYYLSNNVAV